MMKTIAFAAALLFCLPVFAFEAPQDTVLGPGPGAYRLDSDDGTVVIPFEMFRNDIRMFAEVNGRPARLFIDNGYLWDDLLFFGSTRVDSLELKGEGGFGITGSGEGGAVPASVVEGVTVTFPGIEFADQNAYITEYDPALPNLWEGAEGQVSSCFFKHFVVGIDFDAGLITLTEPEHFIYEGTGVEVPLIPLPDGAWAIPAVLELADGRVLELDMMMDLGDGGAVSIETGGPHGIAPPGDALETRLGFGIQGPIMGHAGRVAGLTIGGFRFDEPLADYVSGECEADYTEIMVGMEVFSRFNLHFDYPGRRLILEPGRRFAEPMHYDMSGIFIRPAEGGYSITRVLPDSPGAEAGLVVGDIVVTIDGRPASELRWWDIRPLMRRDGAEVRLGVRSGDSEREVTLTLRRLR